MAANLRCCIKGCRSGSYNTTLFEITKNSDYHIWMQLMKPYLIFKLESVSENYVKRRCVCVRHFEKRFLNGGKRIPRAYPTLFTDEEIRTGRPTIPVEIENAGSMCEQKHFVYHDHMYSILSWLVQVDVQKSDKTQNEGQSVHDAVVDLTIERQIESDKTENEVQNGNNAVLDRIEGETELDKTQNAPQNDNDTVLDGIGNLHIESDETQNEGQNDHYSVFDTIQELEIESDETSNERQSDCRSSLSTVHGNPKKNSTIENNIINTSRVGGPKLQQSVLTHNGGQDNNYTTSDIMADLYLETDIFSDSPLPQYGIVTQLDENGQLISTEIVDMEDFMDGEDLSLTQKSSIQNDDTDKENNPTGLYEETCDLHELIGVEEDPTNSNKYDHRSIDALKEQDCKLLHKESKDSDDLILLEEDPRYSEKSNKENDDIAEDFASISEKFSWHKKYGIVPQTDEDCKILHKDTPAPDDLVMFKEDDLQSQKSVEQNHDMINDIEIDDPLEKQGHEGFQCNCCGNPIVGYRYCCVQCDDYDLCSACESRGAHALHYVLRVPGPRPYEEVQSMLQMIRRQLLRSDVFLKSGDKSTTFAEDGIKLETKEEVEEMDPLDEVEQLENIGEEAVNIKDAIPEVISDNVSSKFISMDETQTYIPDKAAEPQSSVGSHEVFAADLLSDDNSSSYVLTVQQIDCEDSGICMTENNPIQLTLSDELTHFHKTELQDSYNLNEVSTTNSLSKNYPSKLTLSHRSKHFRRKRKLSDLMNCDEDPTADLPSKNILDNPVWFDQSTYFPHKRKYKQSTSKNSNEESKMNFPSKIVSTKPTRSHQPMHFPHKRKSQYCDDSDEASSTDMQSENDISNFITNNEKAYLPECIEAQNQITKNCSIQYIDKNNPKVVYSNIPLELLNQNFFIESNEFSPEIANPSSNLIGSVESEEQGGPLLVTPELVGLSESDLIELLNVEVQGQCAKRILIQVDNSEAKALLYNYGLPK